MNLNEFRDLFKENCLMNNIEYKEDKVEILFEYMRLIQDWNTKVSLTTLNDDVEFCMKHFIDSLTLNKYVDGKNNLIDIGTGAGFPGIPLKIYNPNLKVTLIDSVNKKVNVLNDIIQKLKLKDIEALHIRAEDLAKNFKYREKFDIVTTRAVSNLTTICEYMIPFNKIGGISICMKGPNIEQELEASKKAINILGGKLDKIDYIQISNLYERNLIIVEKSKNTPKEYPRGQGKPLKNPIK